MHSNDVQALEAQLDDPATRETAARTLLPRLREGAEPERLVRAIEALTFATRDRAEEARLLVEAAGVLLCDLRRVEEAFLALARALYLVPGEPTLLEPLRQRVLRANAFEAYRSILGEALEDAPEAARAHLRRELEAAGG